MVDRSGRKRGLKLTTGYDIYVEYRTRVNMKKIYDFIKNRTNHFIKRGKTKPSFSFKEIGNSININQKSVSKCVWILSFFHDPVLCFKQTRKITKNGGVRIYNRVWLKRELRRGENIYN